MLLSNPSGSEPIPDKKSRPAVVERYPTVLDYVQLRLPILPILACRISPRFVRIIFQRHMCTPPQRKPLVYLWGSSYFTLYASGVLLS